MPATQVDLEAFVDGLKQALAWAEADKLSDADNAIIKYTMVDDAGTAAEQWIQYKKNPPPPAP